jgi:DNA-binding transcriptional ArsR family regulator
MNAELINALNHPDALRVLEVLLEGRATRNEIAAELSIKPTQLNYRMRKLEAVGLIRRERSHGPWELAVPSEPVREFLVLLYEIALGVSERELELQRTRVRALREDEK